MDAKGLRNRSTWKDRAGFTLPEVLIMAMERIMMEAITSTSE
jgi:hypothetical protein